MRKLQAMREEELRNVNGRNALITKTLASWNRALGAAGKDGEIADLRAQLEALAKLLEDANAEVAEEANARTAIALAITIAIASRSAAFECPDAWHSHALWLATWWHSHALWLATRGGRLQG